MARFLPKQPPQQYYGLGDNHESDIRHYDQRRRMEGPPTVKVHRRLMVNEDYGFSPPTSSAEHSYPDVKDENYLDNRTREPLVSPRSDVPLRPQQPHDQVFNRHNKNRKSAFKKVISSLSKLFTPEKSSKNIYQGSQKTSESSHSVRRSSSTRISNGSVRRNHSFSGSSHERPRSNAGMRTPALPFVSNTPKLPKREITPPDDMYSKTSVAITPTLTGMPLPLQTGMNNVGNSCYINSVVHLLANIDKFAKLFVTNRYIRYFNRRTEVRDGEVYSFGSPSIVVPLSVTLQCLWLNQNVNYSFSDFVKTVAETSSIFGSGTQQDAQEFLLWILDALHEDLKDTKCPKHSVIPESNALLMKARRSLQSQNNGCSIITALFTAQFVSPIECLTCKSKSYNFEPFKTVSLTVQPIDQSSTYYVIVIFFDVELTRTRIPLHLNQGNPTVSEIFQMLYNISALKDKILMPVLQAYSGSLQILSNRTQIPTNSGRPLYLLEVPNVTGQKGWIAVVCCLAIGTGYDSQIHGPPFVIVAHRDHRLTKILKEFFARASDLVRDEPFDINWAASSLKVFINDKLIVDEFSPVKHAMVNQDGVLTMTVKISRGLASIIFKKFEDNTKELVDPMMKPYVTLEHLLDDFVTKEDLRRTCPQCKDDRCTKQFRFFSLPPILVFHIKRFTLVNGETHRIARPVMIPTVGLNMNPYKYSSKPFGNSGHCSAEMEIGMSEFDDLQDNDGVYDLIGVLNHYGLNVHTGHYSAITKNPIDGRWCIFDDEKTIPCKLDNPFKSSDAYLLVYQRRAKLSLSARVKPTSQHWFSNLDYDIIKRIRGDRTNNGFKSLPRQIPYNGSRFEELSKAKSVQNLSKHQL